MSWIFCTLCVCFVVMVLYVDLCGAASHRALKSPDIAPEPRAWGLDTRIPMIADLEEERKGKFKIKKKFKRFLLPLLLAYKLKFFTLIPVLIGGLVLLTGATGLAGFFFALFAAVMGLKNSGH